MVAQLTEAINSQINKKAKAEVMQDNLPDDILKEINSGVDINPSDDVEQLQDNMTTAIGLMERVLGEAVSQM